MKAGEVKLWVVRFMQPLESAESKALCCAGFAHHEDPLSPSKQTASERATGSHGLLVKNVRGKNTTDSMSQCPSKRLLFNVSRKNSSRQEKLHKSWPFVLFYIFLSGFLRWDLRIWQPWKMCFTHLTFYFRDVVIQMEINPFCCPNWEVCNLISVFTKYLDFFMINRTLLKPRVWMKQWFMPAV